MDTHVNVGMVGALENVGLARRLPLGAALRLTLMGRHYRMPARRAYELGLVDKLVPAPADLPAPRARHGGGHARELAASDGALQAGGLGRDGAGLHPKRSITRGPCCASTGAIPTSARARARSARSASRGGTRIRTHGSGSEGVHTGLRSGSSRPSAPAGGAPSWADWRDLRRLPLPGPALAAGPRVLPGGGRARLARSRLAARGGRARPRPVVRVPLSGTSCAYARVARPPLGAGIVAKTIVRHGTPKRSARAGCRRSARARSTSPSATASPKRAPISRRSARGPSGTATCTSCRVPEVLDFLRPGLRPPVAPLPQRGSQGEPRRRPHAADRRPARRRARRLTPLRRSTASSSTR